MGLPLISIVIPVYNHAKALAESLRSLVRQTYRPLEIIIVNDGSTDGFLEQREVYTSILETAGLKTSIISQANQGASGARNRGLAEACGEFVICWDADTVAEPTMLEQLYQALLTHPEASFAYSPYYFGTKLIKSSAFDPVLLKKINYIDTTSLVRRDHMIAFDPTLKRFQDWDLWLSMVEKGRKGIFVPHPLFKKIVRGRKGYSAWFPSFFLKLPWKTARVRAYYAARDHLFKKHAIHS